MTDTNESDNENVLVFKPKVIILCFEGVVVDNKVDQRYIEPYIRDNMLNYLTEHKNDNQINQIIANLRQRSNYDRADYGYSECPVVVDELPEHTTEQILESVVTYIDWQTNNHRVSNDALRLQKLVCLDGLEKNRIKLKVYSDVVPALKRFRDKLSDIKIALLSAYDETTIRRLLPSNDDIFQYIDRIFDEQIGSSAKVDTFDRIVKALDVRHREEVLYVTGSGRSAVCARNRQSERVDLQNEIKCLLMIRDTSFKIRDYYLINFTTITSLMDIDFQQQQQNGNAF
ncbi:enolase-phosphatase E1-like [Oppia nitens]|uniref:enolase-phosphatase E1-like n=1 Tax=Oppia nitens TaxID=1686743 RepID=UPI0023DBAC86|nr:enolase-phosphatase E1-like [Oppia nitens]